MKQINYLLTIIILSCILCSCGFALRGSELSDYKFPFKTVYIECNGVVICKNLNTAIKTESLATIVNSPTKAEITIKLFNEQTSRDAQSFNAYGRISAYLLTYQTQVAIFNKQKDQLGEDINISQHIVMQYNDTTILADNTEEKDFWNQIHDMATLQLIHRIIYFKAFKAFKHEAESKSSTIITK
jgi:outer membrane lipopolysaccharide assembly protein LptE/RlpB